MAHDGFPYADNVPGNFAYTGAAPKPDPRDAEIERLRAELEGYHEAAQYDATMAGPVFKGWNRSTLDRARRVTEANRADPSREPVDSR